MSFWIGILLVAVAVAGILFYQQHKEKQRIQILSENDLRLTLAELGKYNGITKPRTFVAIKGDVFDVSSSPFYGPGGSYSIFAGKEAGMSLAKGDLAGKDLNRLDYSELSAEEQVALEDWYNRFQQKYRIVGKVVTK